MLLKKFINSVLTDARVQQRFLCFTGISVILTLFVSRLWLLQTRAFDPDELEHMHSVWLISKGFLPFKDYFEHHTPALHFLLAQFIPLFEVETDFKEAKEMLIFGRRIMWLFAGIILFLTFRIGQFWKNWKVGLLGVVFLAGTLMFQEKTLEIRPDLLSLPCWLGCLYLLLRATSLDDGSVKRWLFFATGLLLGTSIMATQKMLFAMPGFTIAMLIYWFIPNYKDSVGSRFVQILFQLLGFFTPIVITLTYFGLRDAAYDFVYFNLLLNLGWEAGFSPYEYSLGLVSQNPFLVGFGLLGLVWSVFKTWGRLTLNTHDYLVEINLIGLIIGLFIIPVPHRQYYLMFLPLLALFASIALVDMVNHLVSLRTSSIRMPLYLKLSLFVLFIALFMLWTFPPISEIEMSDIVKKSILFVIIIGGLLPVILKKADLALAFLIVALQLPTAKKFINKFDRSNRDQLAGIQYVIENSAPDDTFMDGWTGIGVFRPHAYFYWMLHDEIRGMLSEDQKEELFADLKSGKISPVLVNLDENLIELSPEITGFFLENYQAVGVGDIRKRVD